MKYRILESSFLIQQKIVSKHKITVGSKDGIGQSQDDKIHSAKKPVK